MAKPQRRTRNPKKPGLSSRNPVPKRTLSKSASTDAIKTAEELWGSSKKKVAKGTNGTEVAEVKKEKKTTKKPAAKKSPKKAS